MLPLYRTISAVYLVVLTKQENKTLFNRHIEQHYSLSWRDGTPDTIGRQRGVSGSYKEMCHVIDFVESSIS